MKTLQPSENELIGNWIADGAIVRGDDMCKRIEWLTSKILQKITVSKEWGAWETLFRDASDGRYWERTYPQGHLQGGGPPQLRCLTLVEAKAKYGKAVAENQ
jgi:hypothetical protein